MDDEIIKAIVAEIEALLIGRAPGKIFQLGPLSLAIDFRSRDGYLFISADPGLPGLYLIKRRVRDLERQSIPLTQFALALRKELAGASLNSIEKDSTDRVVRFQFAGQDELDQPMERTLVAQLTGRSANLFLLNARDSITHQLRPARGAGQQIGDEYGPGARRALERERGASPTRDSQTGETRVPDRGISPTVREGVSRSKRKPEKIPGVRRYVSSDGFEILVGRTSRDNDHLTFKVAKPNDLWLHAADYGGSHVVVRNSTRKDVPHRTIIEAAQLAAQFSQARKDPKVDVHFTQRKFVSKSKGAAPGLVRMTRFKNITVAPKEAVERI